jgi:hypothetical protein
MKGLCGKFTKDKAFSILDNILELKDRKIKVKNDTQSRLAKT